MPWTNSGARFVPLTLLLAACAPAPGVVSPAAEPGVLVVDNRHPRMGAVNVFVYQASMLVGDGPRTLLGRVESGESESFEVRLIHGETLLAETATGGRLVANPAPTLSDGRVVKWNLLTGIVRHQPRPDTPR